MADDAVMPDLEIHATGEVQNPSDALDRALVELTMWRNLAHQAYELLTEAQSADFPFSCQEPGTVDAWVRRYGALTHGG